MRDTALPKRAALAALLATGLALASLAAVAGSARAITGTPCGNVDGEFSVEVVVGNVSCEKALSVSKRFLSSRHCGLEREPACVDDGFHCRLSLFSEQVKNGIGSYCYVLKQSRPASQDHTGFHPARFEKAFTITLEEEERPARSQAPAPAGLARPS